MLSSLDSRSLLSSGYNPDENFARVSRELSLFFLVYFNVQKLTVITSLTGDNAVIFFRLVQVK